MLSILIVDDHRTERETIQFLIKRSQLELDTHLAANGIEALTIVQSRPIDILFADIKMPKLGGLELIKRSRAINPDLKVIIFTGYAEFEFARAAVALGVQEYLLKPLVVEDFIAVVKRVISQCQYERQIAQFSKEKLLLDLMHGKPVSRDVVTQLVRLGVDLEKTEVVIALLVSEEPIFDTQDQFIRKRIGASDWRDCVYFSANEWEAVALLNPGHGDSFARDVLRLFKESLGHDLFVALSSPFRGYGTVREIYRDLTGLLDLRFFAERGTIYRQSQNQPEDTTALSFQVLMGSIMEAVAEEHWDRARRQIGMLFTHLGEQRSCPSVQNIRAVCLTILNDLHRESIPERVEAIRVALAAANISELYLLLIHRVDALAGGAGEPAQHARHSRVVKHCVDFVNGAYMRPIGVSEIADTASLNPDYLGHLFKRETGVSLTQLILSVRMARAEELVRTTNLRIREIAERVGYADQSYFGQMFRNSFGTSPSRYRKLTE